MTLTHLLQNPALRSIQGVLTGDPPLTSTLPPAAPPLPYADFEFLALPSPGVPVAPDVAGLGRRDVVLLLPALLLLLGGRFRSAATPPQAASSHRSGGTPGRIFRQGRGRRLGRQRRGNLRDS